MKNGEIVKALRDTESRSKRELLDAAADLIEKLTDRCARYAEEIAVAQAKEIDALRNELCLKCGNYTLAHEGACGGCKWREM